MEISFKNIPIEKMNANFIVDYCYDIIMELLRAKMFMDGYNPGNSHEAEVSYLLKLEFSISDVRFMDELRYNRNGTKYYGEILELEYSNKVRKFMNRIYLRLNKEIKIENYF